MFHSSNFLVQIFPFLAAIATIVAFFYFLKFAKKFRTSEIREIINSLALITFLLFITYVTGILTAIKEALPAAFSEQLFNLHLITTTAAAIGLIYAITKIKKFTDTYTFK